MAPTIDISAWIDQQKISRIQVAVLCICALAAMLEGLDAQVIGYLAPAISADWQIPAHSFTPVFVAGLVGLLFGCLFIAPLADVLGRKSVLFGSMAVFGTFSLLSASAASMHSLMVLRFLTDAGLGAGMANAIAMTSEFFPTHRRAAMTVLMFCGFPLGAALGGVLSAVLIPRSGWSAVFYWGGVLPLFAAVIVAGWLPESLRHMVVKGADPEHIAAILRRINPRATFPVDAKFVTREERRPGLTVRHLFDAGRTSGTLLLWVIFFMSLLDIFLLTSWMPSVLHDAGLSISVSVVITAMLQGSGVLASLAIGPVLTRRGCLQVLLPLYLVGGAGIAAIGLAGSALWPIILAACATGAGIVAGQNTANALASIYYPTYMRATGVGWALGIGRVGAILGPVLGGLMISLQWSREALFLVGAIPALVAALAALALLRLERSRSAASPRPGLTASLE